jgi:hypothetical protein
MNNKIKIIINRYELFPDPSNGRIVGFLIKNTDTDKAEYVESVVSTVGLGDSENEVCKIAYNQIKDQIDSISTRLSQSSSVVGSEFIP